MMDDKMKAALREYCNTMGDTSPEGMAEWVLGYLRSQRADPIGEVSGNDTETAILYDEYDPGAPVYAEPHLVVTTQLARQAVFDLAKECGARLTGKPDGSEPIEVQFPADAWCAFSDKLEAHPMLSEQEKK